jgi:hypothetical protein
MPNDGSKTNAKWPGRTWSEVVLSKEHCNHSLRNVEKERE